MIEVGNHAKPGILLVDDEVEMLNSLSDLLRRDFHILATGDIREALDIVAHQDNLTIIMSDQRMPGITGAEFLALAADISPDTARILMTAYADLNAVIEAVNKGQIMQYITKPWESDALLATLKSVAERHILFRENRRLVHQLLHTLQPNEAPAQSGKSLPEPLSMKLRNENQLLERACRQIERSHWQLDFVQKVVPICLNCGKRGKIIPSPRIGGTLQGSKPHIIGHGYCQECLQKLKALPDEGPAPHPDRDDDSGR